MGTLTGCLRKSNLSESEKTAIKSAAKEYREEEGMSAKAAALSAINDEITETVSSRNDIAKIVEQRGGVMPDAPEVKPAIDEVPAAAGGVPGVAGGVPGVAGGVPGAQEVEKPSMVPETEVKEDIEEVEVSPAEEVAEETVEEPVEELPGMPSGVGAKQGGALDIEAFLPRKSVRPVDEHYIITGFTDAGKPIRKKTSHPSLKDRGMINKFWTRNFVKEGLLPDEAFNRKIEMEGAMSETGVHEEFIVDVFKKTIKKFTGSSYKNLSAKEKQMLNKALAGDEAVMDALHPEVEKVVRAMRDHLDQQSTELMRTLSELIEVRMDALDDKPKKETSAVIADIFDGKAEEEIEISPGADQNIIRKAWLIHTIQSNKGSYLNRAYQAFDDPRWEKKIRKNEEVMSDAREHIKEGVLEREADALLKEAKRRVEENSPWKEMLKGKGSLQDKKDLRDEMVESELLEVKKDEGMTPSEINDEVEGHINKILESSKSGGDLVSMLSSKKLGQKDLGILRRRKDIHVSIRNLLGEYKDPTYNYTRSASKMAYLVAQHDFLMNIRKDGLGAFLSEGLTEKFHVQIMTKDPDTMTPLTGLYSTPEFTLALEDAVGPKQRSALLRFWLRSNGIVKYGATVLSPITMARNFLSAAMFTVMNGHFNWAYSGKSSGVVGADMFKVGDLKRWETYMSKLIKLGVLHSGVRSEELRETAMDAMDLEKQVNRAQEVARNVFVKIPTALYRAGDDFWKVIGFENEKASLMRWRKIPEAEAEVIAAERIRNGYPTYSHVPRAIRSLRMFPLLGPFVSFPWEIMRTTSHQLRFVEEDLKAGATAAAARRAAGMLIAGAVPSMIGIAAMTASGVDKEEDEAHRSVGPWWQRNANLIYMRDAAGKLWTLDASHLDPYTYIKAPITAMFNGNNEGAWKKLADSFAQLAGPFLGTELTTGAMLEVAMNKTLDMGLEVYNEQANRVDQSVSALNHLRRRLQPGIARQVENLVKAYNDEVSRGGKQYTMTGELASFAGLKFTPVNARVALKYRASEFGYAKRDASRLLSYPLKDPNELKEREIDSPIDDLFEAHERIYKDMIKAVKAAMSLGLNKSQVIQILRAAGIGDKDISALITGRMPVFEPSPGFIKRARELAIATAETPEERRKAAITFGRRHGQLLRRIANKRRELANSKKQ